MAAELGRGDGSVLQELRHGLHRLVHKGSHGDDGTVQLPPQGPDLVRGQAPVVPEEVDDEAAPGGPRLVDILDITGPVQPSDFDLRHFAVSRIAFNKLISRLAVVFFFFLCLLFFCKT